MTRATCTSAPYTATANLKIVFLERTSAVASGPKSDRPVLAAARSSMIPVVSKRVHPGATGTPVTRAFGRSTGAADFLANIIDASTDDGRCGKL